MTASDTECELKAKNQLVDELNLSAHGLECLFRISSFGFRILRMREVIHAAHSLCRS